MKRFLSLFLTLILLLSFAGCNDKGVVIELGEQVTTQYGLAQTITFSECEGVTDYVCFADAGSLYNGVKKADIIAVEPGGSLMFFKEWNSRCFIRVLMRNLGKTVGFTIIKVETDLIAEHYNPNITKMEVVKTHWLSDKEKEKGDEYVDSLMSEGIKKENIKDGVFLNFSNWVFTNQSYSYKIEFLEYADATEYSCSVIRGSFGSGSSFNPGDVAYWHIAGEETYLYGSYIKITVKSDRDIIAYSVVKVVLPDVVTYLPKVVETVAFTKDQIREGITQEYVDGLMDEVIQREERK